MNSKGTRSDTWRLSQRTIKLSVLIKWFFKSNLDEHGTVIRNKAILVAKWYNQQEFLLMLLG